MSEDATAYKVEAFVEKPTAKVAATFLADGAYYWNSGMFMLKAATSLEELERLQPEMCKQVETALRQGEIDTEFIRLDAEAFAACPNDSIDYAVMEQTDAAAVIEAVSLGWSDIGLGVPWLIWMRVMSTVM